MIQFILGVVDMMGSETGGGGKQASGKNRQQQVHITHWNAQLMISMLYVGPCQEN